MRGDYIFLIPNVLAVLVNFRDGTAVVLDKCEASRNCSVKMDNSTTLLCWVGHKEACDDSKIKLKAAASEPPVSYPSLATIGIYKRPYRDTAFNSLNFSFTLSQTDGVQAVIAEFNEATGYHDNKRYKKPICRIFDLSTSSQSALELISRKRVEISYDCIGIGILPSVFQLRLISMPMSHQVDYTITWHDNPEYHDYYYYYDFTKTGPESVWTEQIVAVASLPHQRKIHVVFPSPNSNVKVPFVRLSLENLTGVVKFIQVESNSTSVTFTDVEPGQYWVTVSPKGGECDLEPNLCIEFKSVEIAYKGLISAGNISEHLRNSKESATALMTVADSSTTDTRLIIVLLATVGFIVVLALTIGCFLYHRRNGTHLQRKKKTIQIISMSSRHLENQVASYFSSFLTSVIDASVKLTHFDRVLLQPRFNIRENGHRGTDNSEKKLLQTTKGDKTSDIFVVIHFSYRPSYAESQGCLKMEATSKYRDLDSSLCSSKRHVGLLPLFEYLMERSRNVFLVTFSLGDFNQGEFPKSLGSRIEKYSASDDDVTVIRHKRAREKLGTDTVSKLNQSFVQGGQFTKLSDALKDYVLPGDLYKLYEDLRCKTSSRTKCLDEDQLNASGLWQLAYTVFRKATENTTRDGYCEKWALHDDGASVTETLPETVTECGETRRGDIRYRYNDPVGLAPPIKKLQESNICDSFSNITEAEQDMRSQADLTQWELLSMPDSFSNITEAEHDLLFHETDKESTSLPEACPATDCSGCKHFQRMCSMKSSKTSGYGSTQGDIYSPTSDSVQSYSELPKVEWDDRDCHASLIPEEDE